ncbi:MAG: SOS response-associated peptidase [Bacteroidota bacterium]
MCGRYSFNVKKAELKVQLPGVSLPDHWIENLNICPSEQALVICKGNQLVLTAMKWGFTNKGLSGIEMVPHINARSETVFEKRRFKDAILHKRCIIPADSFYEWGKYGKTKIPYRILPSDDAILYMAGIWESFQHDNILFSSFVLVTTEANEDLSDLHHRMPVCLNTEEERENWLSDLTSTGDLVSLMKPVKKGYFKKYAVSNLVNNIKVKSGSLHERINAPLTLF